MEPILAVNAGSATLKMALVAVDAGIRELRAKTWTGSIAEREAEALDAIAAFTGGAPVGAIGHRLVHGGPRHHRAERITPPLLRELESLVSLAPHHLPSALGLIRALQQKHAGVPQIVCFDTSFHHDLPEIAARLPIPRSYDASGLRRYGFHGLSFAYIVEELRGSDPALLGGRLVLAHLGNGSSLAAVRDGRSIDTSMSFTPLGGTMMSTRSGDIDPGVVAFIAQREGLSGDGIEALFGGRSGLAAVSGSTGDVRELLDREAADPRARLALDMYAYQVRKWIGAFAAALGGLDGLVFSGGIGEHSPDVRSRICAELAFLGVQLDRQRNSANSRAISPPGARVAVLVIPTNEAITIARDTLVALGHES
jgi:acetate kinase